MNYVRLFSISVFITLFIFSVLTEDAKAQSVKLGLVGGMNISSHTKKFWYQSEDIHLDLKPTVAIGYQGGFMVRKDFARYFRLQAEPSIILLGARYDESFTLRGFDFQTESRTDLLYIQLPLLFQLSTVPSKKKVFGRPFARTTYHITGGVFGGYLLDAQFSGTNTGTPVGINFEGDFSNDVTPQYKEYDGGVIFGIGLEHGYDSKLGFETRVIYSLLKTGDDPDLRWFRPQNMGITFSVYYLF